MSGSKILKKSITTAMLFAGFASIPTGAQTPEQIARFEERSYTSTSNSITIPYRLFVPDNYNPANRFPLVTCLHGNGERTTSGNSCSTSPRNGLRTAYRPGCRISSLRRIRPWGGPMPHNKTL
ncbi:MAG: hypothetical protein JW768_11310 [Chitinispirillaceae bacterium]|nr:hypothetical protein [Chitinispirillaceae bacterium]